MASQYLPTLVTVVAGTGSSANLVASSTGQSIRVWQLLIVGTGADTVTVAFTAGGVAASIKVILAVNTTFILPMTGVPWAIADVGTAVTFTAASSTTVTAYYTKGLGG